MCRIFNCRNKYLPLLLSSTSYLLINLPLQVRVLQQLIAFIYTGEFGGRGKEEVAALADFLQLKVDLQEKEKEKEKEGKGAPAKESPATKGASWNDFIAENGASPAAPSPAPGRKRGRPATPAQQETPVKKRGKTEDNVKVWINLASPSSFKSPMTWWPGGSIGSLS